MQSAQRLIGIIYGNSGTGIANKLFETQLKDTAQSLSQIHTSNSNYTIEKIEVPTQIKVVEKLDKDEIKRHSETIGKIAAEYIQEGFTQRGIKSSVSLF